MGPAQLQTLCQFLTAFGLVLAALAGFGAYYFGNLVAKQQSRISAQAGTLGVAKSDRINANNSSDLPNEYKKFPAMRIGDNGPLLVFTGESGKPMFEIFGESLRIENVDNKLLVSFAIRDPEGRLILQLIENTWKTNPQQLWDRNYSDHALEIQGPDGTVMFQVKLVNGEARIQMRIRDASGGIFGLWESNDPELPGALKHYCPPGTECTIPELVPIFKYPSELYFGEFADSHNKNKD